MADTTRTKPEVGGDLVRVHRAITRALSITHSQGDAYAAQGLPEAQTWKGYLSYARCTVTLLHGHHVTEDEAMFPYFRARFPNAPYDTLTAQHQEMVRILHEIAPALKNLQSAEPLSALRAFTPGVKQIAELWETHAGLEQAHFGPEAIDAAYTMRERERAGLAIMARGAPHQWPPMLMIPFTFYNMPPSDRAIMERAIPVIMPLMLSLSRPWWKIMAPLLIL